MNPVFEWSDFGSLLYTENGFDVENAKLTGSSEKFHEKIKNFTKKISTKHNTDEYHFFDRSYLLTDGRPWVTPSVLITLKMEVLTGRDFFESESTLAFFFLFPSSRSFSSIISRCLLQVRSLRSRSRSSSSGLKTVKRKKNF